MIELTCDVLIIGAGPGGYVCAVRAGQLGLNTVIVEAEAPGGACLNVGCIPSKAIIHAADEFFYVKQLSRAANSASAIGISATNASIDFTQTQNWKNSLVKRLIGGVNGLLKNAGVKHIHGTARFRDGKTVNVTPPSKSSNSEPDADLENYIIHAENIVIATGSEPIELSSIPFSANVLSSTEALSLTTLPETLAVVGGGYIGLEIGTAYAKLGTAVTIIESADHILPQYDTALSNPILARLAQLDVRVLSASIAQNYNQQTSTLQIKNKGGDTVSCKAEKVLVTIGRQPRLLGWGLSELSLTLDRGFVAIDQKCQTSMRGVYAVGDVTGEPMLAHRAMAQGEMVAQLLAGHGSEWDKACIPAVCFTDPEIVSVGLTVEEADCAGMQVLQGEFPFHANGRAMSIEQEAGFIRVIMREDNHALLGVQGVGAGIAELSAAFALAIEMGARADDIAATVHAHPTLSESFNEACLKALGQALHL